VAAVRSHRATSAENGERAVLRVLERAPQSHSGALKTPLRGPDAPCARPPDRPTVLATPLRE